MGLLMDGGMFVLGVLAGWRYTKSSVKAVVTTAVADVQSEFSKATVDFNAVKTKVAAILAKL